MGSSKASIRTRGAAVLVVLIASGAIAESIPALGIQGRASPSPPTCSYLRGGPSGPRGNVLLIEGSGILSREGSKLKVSDLGRKHSSVSCSGGEPTTTNVDRVRVVVGDANGGQFVLDERKGLLAPGASHEQGSSEIEIAVDFARPSRALLKIWGARRGNAVTAATLKSGAIGVNLDRTADRGSRDLDLITQRTKLLKFLGGPGTDHVSGARLRSFAKNPKGAGYNPFDDRLHVEGKGGDDVLIGSPGRDFLLAGLGADFFRGGPGTDLVIGGREGDDLQLSRGSTTVYGGPGRDQIGALFGRRTAGGRDRLFGGTGNDNINSANEESDMVDCGVGDDFVAADPSELLLRCERREFPHR
jgi:hypothetical protein